MARCGARSRRRRFCADGAVSSRLALARSANGGYSVELPVVMDLVEPVKIRAGDVLRVDVSGSPEASSSLPAAGEEPVVHRIWHAPKWASTVRLGVKMVDGALKLDLPFAKGPKVTQPVP